MFSLNLVDNLILAFVNSAAWLRVLFSLLNLCIFPTAAMFVFYTGYKGIAKGSPTEMQKFVVFQAILVRSVTCTHQCLFDLFASLAPLMGFNGFLIYVTAEKKDMSNTGASSLWSVAMTIESCIFLGLLCLGVYNIVKVQAIKNSNGM